ncbi:hypothetical protein ATCC90586_002752 [Pythium insidiosum]|nr:hypothetical protein ATCC90586_002752 [Pythium insidiosum]
MMKPRASIVPDHVKPPLRQEHARVVVQLSSRWYRAVWLAIWATHALCSAFVGGAAWLYWYADRPYLTYFADLVAPKPQRHFHTAGSVCVALAALQAASCLEMIVLSLLSRRLVLSRGEFYLLRQTRVNMVDRTRPEALPSPLTQSFLRFPWAACQFLWWACFTRRGILGVDSPFFEIVFTVRECFEVALQTYQAYLMSGRITEPSLNAAFVALLTLNCWIISLLQRTLHRRPAVARCACLVADVAINACANMLIPCLILAPYVRAWDAQQFTYDIGLLYDDLWFTNMVMEHRMLFAVSRLDVFSKLVPHGKMLLCLIKIRSLVERARDRKPVVPRASDDTQPRKNSLSLHLVPPKMDMRSRRTLIVHLILVAWGIGVLAAHLHANNAAPPASSGCKQVMHPWFASTFSCATLEVNCYRLRSDTMPNDFLVGLHPAYLLSVVFSHCGALEMPTDIQRFPNLIGVEIYNATLASWSADAALQPSNHQSLAFLLVIRVSLTVLPAGIMGPLPETLTDVEFVFTNLTTLPEDLHERWNGMATFYLEYSHLSAFPQTLCRLPVYDLSLIGNRIETIPELTQLPTTEFYTLALSRNPLRELPAALPADITFAFLMLEETNLAAPLPSWVEQRVQERVYLSGSACCLSANETEGACGVHGVGTCIERDPRGEGRYPWETMTPRRVP